MFYFDVLGQPGTPGLPGIYILKNMLIQFFCFNIHPLKFIFTKKI